MAGLDQRVNAVVVVWLVELNYTPHYFDIFIG